MYNKNSEALKYMSKAFGSCLRSYRAFANVHLEPTLYNTQAQSCIII